MSRASCASPSAWGSSRPEPDPPVPHQRHGACSLFPEQRDAPASRRESAADFAATRHMIPSVNGFTGAVEPVDLAQRLDREAAGRVLATLSTKGTVDDQLAALLERSFHAALLDASARCRRSRDKPRSHRRRRCPPLPPRCRQVWSTDLPRRTSTERRRRLHRCRPSSKC